MCLSKRLDGDKNGGEAMGYKIKERREELQMTQEELTKKSGISRQTISALENAYQKNCSTRVLLALAKALDTTISELFFEDDV